MIRGYFTPGSIWTQKPMDEHYMKLPFFRQHYKEKNIRGIAKFEDKNFQFTPMAFQKLK